MAAVLALSHEPVDYVAVLVALAAMTLWIWWDHKPSRRDKRGKR